MTMVNLSRRYNQLQRVHLLTGNINDIAVGVKVVTRGNNQIKFSWRLFSW